MAKMDVSDEPTLRQLFEAGWEAQRKTESGELSSNTQDYKVLVCDGVSSLERATRLVNQLSLFSGNEAVEELPTSDLRYLLLPALLGDLTLQHNDGERLECLSRARVYFVDYLQRCKSYSITQQDPPTKREAGASSVSQKGQNYEQASSDRATKIARLRAKKEMEKKIQGLADRLKVSSSEDSDDLLREHLLAVLQYWVIKCQEGVVSIDQEIELLEGMAQMRDGPGRVAMQQGAKPPPPNRRPNPPIVITRDMIQGKVFGGGYPSLPSMSVEEWFDEQYGGTRPPVPKSRVEGEEEEEEEEKEETEESLKQARDFDEHKDSNRRGCGNRKNMG
ncbi:immunoglobulin-binding protein 1-like [Halichondria panicea]|uniref:immunoglobulin-binding protein 1-like n=1 Tax=Halichondria panicea TaxID=6063 RepID=UPI00312B6EE0